MLENLDIAVVGIGVLCCSIGMAHTFYHSNRKGWQTALCWTTCVLLMVLCSSLLHLVLGSRAWQLVGLLMAPAYLYLFDAPVRQRLFTFFFVSTYLYGGGLLAMYTAWLFHPFLPGILPHFGFTGLYCLAAGASLWFFWKKLRQPILHWLTQFEKRFCTATLFAAAGYLLLLSFDLSAGRESIRVPEYLSMVLYLVLLGAGYSLAFFNMAVAGEAFEAKRQTQKISEELRQAVQYYETLTTQQQRFRRMQHDMRHHFRVLESCLRDAQPQRMQSYLEELLDSIPERAGPILCANYTAGILLRYYGERAAGAGIRFQCDAQIPAELPVQDSHLSVMLGNALQNAMEACQKLPAGEQRFIQLLARVRGGFLTLEIKNSFDGAVTYDSKGRMKSGKTESGHGLGLYSIADIAQRYHGYYSARPEGETFILHVVLGLTGESTTDVINYPL